MVDELIRFFKFVSLLNYFYSTSLKVLIIWVHTPFDLFENAYQIHIYTLDILFTFTYLIKLILC